MGEEHRGSPNRRRSDPRRSTRPRHLAHPSGRRAPLRPEAPPGWTGHGRRMMQPGHAIAPSGLRSVEGGGLRHEISDILREAIWTGVLRPGQRLSENWLAGEIGVSRPPLREAIRVLEQEGLVVSIPRRGSFVRTLAGQDISEIYTVRCALEGMAAELAMEALPHELERLDQMVVQV